MMPWDSWVSPRSKPQNATSQNFLDAIVDPENAKIDIVAVHGLNPFNRPDHAVSTWTTGGKLWLRDKGFLPDRLPFARVMLFGYNSNVAFGTTASGLIEQADNLLNRLASKRADDPDRPLIFICHSLGGLIVKRALIASNGDNTYTKICAATYGIAFFGTPHSGGKGAAIGAIAAVITRAVLGNPPNTFMEALKSKSALLDTITADFRQFLERLYFISFFETRALAKTRNIVVDATSATLGLGRAREKQIGLDATHSGLCKFASPHDAAYQQVQDNIADMVQAALEERVEAAVPSITLPGNTSTTEGENNILMQLGQANHVFIHGSTNQTHQIGEANKSNTDGRQNKTTQISMDATAALEASRSYLAEHGWGRLARA